MKKFSVLLLFLLLLPLTVVYASSDQARRDYQFQFDMYRQKNTEFQIAKNEYAKFRTLMAQTTALEKTRSLLAQRDQLLHSYLSLLGEKLTEDQGLSASTKQLYIGIIQNELVFLERHAQLIPSIGSLDDAVHVSQELESHYKILSISMRQILVGLSVGQLAILANKFDSSVRDAQAIVSTFGGTFTPEKQQTINRWILQINNKRSFYQQKVDGIVSTSAQLEASDLNDLETKFNEMQQTIAEARQYLLEGAAFMTELKTALKYIQ